MFNMAILIGRVGKKEVRNLKDGGKLVDISLATEKRYKDSNGKLQEDTTWHIVHCFDKLSEIAEKHIKVGDMALVRGMIQNRKVNKTPEIEYYVYSVTAHEIKFIPNAAREDRTNFD